MSKIGKLPRSGIPGNKAGVETNILFCNIPTIQFSNTVK